MFLCEEDRLPGQPRHGDPYCCTETNETCSSQPIELSVWTDYLTLTYFRSTRGRGSPANTLPNLSTVPNSAPLPVVVPGLPPWSRMKYFTQPLRAPPILMPCSKPGLSTLSDSES